MSSVVLIPRPANSAIGFTSAPFGKSPICTPPLPTPPPRVSRPLPRNTPPIGTPPLDQQKILSQVASTLVQLSGTGEKKS